MSERSGNLTLILAIVAVLAVMGFLMELLTRRMDHKLRESPHSLAELQIRQLHYAVEAFRLEVGRYPRPEEGLEALVRAPEDAAGRWKGPYLQRPSVPLDPWQRPYRYEPAPEGGFAIVSLGADGKPGGAGPDADIFSTKIVEGPKG
jgi:general secretion pathway protein G